MASKTSSKSVPKPNAKVSTKAEAKVETKAEAKVEVEAKVEAKQPAKVEAKTESKNSKNNTIVSKFNFDNIKYGEIYSDIYNNKSISTSYKDRSSIFVVAHKCKIITYTDEEGKKQLYVGITDEEFLNQIKIYNAHTVKYVSKNSKSFLGDDYTEEDCEGMLKPDTIQFKEQYGHSVSALLSKKTFICKSKTDDIQDVSDLSVALQKGNIVDICFDLIKIKLGLNKFSVGMEIKQVNIIGLGDFSQYKSNAIEPKDFNKSLIKVSEIETLDKGNKKTSILYGDGEKPKTIRINLENLKNCRLFENKQQVENRQTGVKEDKASYSLRIPLSDPVHKQMFDDIYEESLAQFNELTSKGLDSNKKILKAKQNRKEFKSILSYGKEDQERIKKNETPTYSPSTYIKMFYSTEKAFDGKITNSAGEKITNPEDLLNKDLSIESLEIYNKHIWICSKGTSINFTLNKCVVNNDVPPSYNMDYIDSLESKNEDVEEVTNSKKAETAPKTVPKPAASKAKEESSEEESEEVENSSEEEEEESDTN